MVIPIFKRILDRKGTSQTQIFEITFCGFSRHKYTSSCYFLHFAVTSVFLFSLELPSLADGRIFGRICTKEWVWYTIYVICRIMVVPNYCQCYVQRPSTEIWPEQDHLKELK